MNGEVEIGYGCPPEQTRWRKGQSGNPKGRPKSRSELVMDAATILNQPIEARTPDGRTVKLDGVEAAYLALCRKGLKGHKASLLNAIRIMLEVGPAIQAQEQSEEAEQQEFVALFERMGVKIPESSE